jgi:hypothetical protein
MPVARTVPPGKLPIREKSGWQTLFVPDDPVLERQNRVGPGLPPDSVRTESMRYTPILPH